MTIMRDLLQGAIVSLVIALGSLYASGATAGLPSSDGPETVRSTAGQACSGTPGETPAITSKQIEADWLHQDDIRLKPAPGVPRNNVTPQQDAVGAVDGIKTGKWGFHTENENNPWWQVDLGKPTTLGRMLLYNRCDGGFASRASKLIVLLSDDGRKFRQVYQHDGTAFLGQPDKKPAAIDLKKAKAQFVRIQLPYTSYFHLDEVEIYAPDGDENIALGKPATQSSTSTWSVRHDQVVGPNTLQTEPSRQYATTTVIERGLELAASLQRFEDNGPFLELVNKQRQVLNDVQKRLRALPADASNDVQRELYMEAHWAVRRMTMANPLLDFDTILFVKRAPPMFPHMSDQFYGWWSRPGGNICLLKNFSSDKPTVECITKNWDDGTFLRPDLSYDGSKVLFAYCKYYPHVAHMADKTDKEALPEDACFHIYEMNVDGTNVRQLTFGRYDDFDARYLPNGDIVFLSTRKGTAIQANRASALATETDGACVDSYVRCGGGNSRPVAVFTLHRMDGNGKKLRAISAFENFEWTPSIAADGRILYARWDYIDRFNGPFISLWSTNPDGTNAQLVYGNYTKAPQCLFEARPIPGSQKLLFTACAHHSNTGGALALLDRTRGTEFERPLTRLTPEVPFPETEAWADSYYANPYPLSEEHFLVAWSDKRLPGHSRFAVDDPRNPPNSIGIYLYDAFGNLEPLFRDPDISSMYPLPVRSRPKPPIITDIVDWDAPREGPEEGRLLVQDVYTGLDGVEPGSIVGLRVIAVPPKVQPQMNSPVLGVSAEDPGKFVLGTVPVEEDGSAYFHVPSGVPVFFQAIDREGLAIQTMRTLTYVQPDQTMACIGCHEHRDLAPRTTSAPLATLREPSKLRPAPSGSWPLRFDELVQPVLDRSCVKCHHPKSDDAKAAEFDLTPAKAYHSLISYADKDLHRLSFERDRSRVGDMPARQSKLLALLRKEGGHGSVQLDADSFERLVTWMDTYVHRVGSFSLEQEQDLRAFRQTMAPILEE